MRYARSHSQLCYTHALGDWRLALAGGAKKRLIEHVHMANHESSCRTMAARTVMSPTEKSREFICTITSCVRPFLPGKPVAPPMEPEMHYTRTFLFAAEVVHRSWAVYFLFISSYIHKLFSTFITFVGHNRSIHQF